MSDEQPTKPKIIVDDDWKERVQAEKEAAQKGRDEQPQTDAAAQELPPASFPMLVTSLATQALATMGQIPDPSGKSLVQLDHARHVIDTLAMLEEKTKGNLTPEESQMMTQVLHELRMVFVAVSNAPAHEPPAEDKPKFTTS
jgi:hypothetical protein